MNALAAGRCLATGRTGHGALSASTSAGVWHEWQQAQHRGDHFNPFNTRLDMGWIFGIAFAAVGAYKRSVAQRPNIKPGLEFDGYPAPKEKAPKAKEMTHA